MPIPIPTLKQSILPHAIVQSNHILQTWWICSTDSHISSLQSNDTNCRIWSLFYEVTVANLSSLELAEHINPKLTTSHIDFHYHASPFKQTRQYTP